MNYRMLLGFSIGLGFGCEALAQDKYNVTPEERAACQQDATLLCSYAYPDEDKLIACMKANKTQLSVGCRRSFEAGLRKRHLSSI